MSSTHHQPLTPALLAELRSIVGEEGLIADPHELLVYECDAYTLEKNLPQVVTLPASTEQVIAIVQACARHGVPIIPRGAGTSLSGTVLAVDGVGILIAMTRLNRILSIDYRNRRVLVEAGCVNAWVTNAVKDQGLFYAPDPSSQSACTIGGNVEIGRAHV